MSKVKCRVCDRDVGTEKSQARGYEHVDQFVWHVERKNGLSCSGSGVVVDYPAAILARSPALTAKDNADG